MRLATREQKVNARRQHTSCGAQNSVLEAGKLGFWDITGTGSADLAYSRFNSIAAWISTGPLDFPKNRYSLGLRASRLRLSVRTEVSSPNSSSRVVTLSAVPRIAEVSVSMEGAGDAIGKVGCCVVTSGLGLNRTRSLSSESWSSLKIIGSGTSYGLI
jgi:hypothetical protein